ncbi:MAG: J domain-containing protein, partial [Kofleriaceae bacterium]|nr:J domain-containing protein [Kofleriaceae bacterium]
MSGPSPSALRDEANARAALQVMMARLVEAPHVLLGVPATVAAPELRAAFLRLTKQFHPARYARFSPEVVKMANEVFLTIKRAHDQLLTGINRAAGIPTRAHSASSGPYQRASTAAGSPAPPPTSPAPTRAPPSTP